MSFNVCEASSKSSWPNALETNGSSCGGTTYYEKDPDQLSTIDLQASRKRQVKQESKLESQVQQAVLNLA